MKRGSGDMKEEVSGCGRENELVSFLYGELNAEEAQAFQRHLQACRACSAELSAFRDIHASVVTWRDESLAGVFSPAPANNPAVGLITERRPSAIAALREFFNLSPLWMKGAVAFASLLFCLFTSLTILQWRGTPSTIAVVESERKYTGAEVDKLVQQAVDQVKKEQAGGPGQLLAASDLTPNSGKTKRSGNHKSSVARRPLSKTEREQLALDLRLATPQHEGEMDLLADRINQ